MAQLDFMNDGQGFDADKVSDYTGIPSGAHPVRIVESELKPTNDGTGKRLILTIQVEDGEHKGKRHWEGLNIINRSMQAQEISERMLKKIMAACGLSGQLTDSVQLHNIPFMATFAVKDEGQYGKKSELKKVAPYGHIPTGQIKGREEADGAPYSSASQGPAGDGKKRPWD